MDNDSFVVWRKDLGKLALKLQDVGELLLKACGDKVRLRFETYDGVTTEGVVAAVVFREMRIFRKDGRSYAEDGVAHHVTGVILDGYDKETVELGPIAKVYAVG